MILRRLRTGWRCIVLTGKLTGKFIGKLMMKIRALVMGVGGAVNVHRLGRMMN